jgi:hypothetical protein
MNENNQVNQTKPKFLHGIRAGQLAFAPFSVACATVRCFHRVREIPLVVVVHRVCRERFCRACRVCHERFCRASLQSRVSRGTIARASRVCLCSLSRGTIASASVPWVEVVAAK